MPRFEPAKARTSVMARFLSRNDAVADPVVEIDPVNLARKLELVLVFQSSPSAVPCGVMTDARDLAEYRCLALDPCLARVFRLQQNRIGWGIWRRCAARSGSIQSGPPRRGGMFQPEMIPLFPANAISP